MVLVRHRTYIHLRHARTRMVCLTASFCQQGEVVTIQCVLGDSSAIGSPLAGLHRVRTMQIFQYKRCANGISEDIFNTKLEESGRSREGVLYRSRLACWSLYPSNLYLPVTLALSSLRDCFCISPDIESGDSESTCEERRE